MILLIFFVVLWYTSLFCQTFFQHRYAAHGAFKMTKNWEKVFFVFTYICQGSSYMSPRAYAIMHRMHHAYTDTEMDPHSPSFSKNIFSRQDAGNAWAKCQKTNLLSKYQIFGRK